MSDGFSWTKEQRCAIESRGGPLLVSAAAGSGKTAVLVQRIIEIITDSQSPVDIDRFLVVTYTNAAAAEMKQKISTALDKLLGDDPFNKNLLRQQLLLQKAQISTIHSFCSALAREYFYALDIPSDFRVAESEEIAVLKDTAINAVFERKYEEQDKAFLRLIDAFSGNNNDKGLQNLVYNLYDFLRSQPFPKKWQAEVLDMYQNVGEPGQTVWGEQIRRYAEMQFEFVRFQSEGILEICRSEPELIAKCMDAAEGDEMLVRELHGLLEAGAWDDICEFFAKLKYKAFKNTSLKKSSAIVQTKCDIIQSKRKLLKDSMKKIGKLFSKDAESFKKEILDILPTAQGMFELVNAFEAEFSAIKLERSIADFNDLEHWALSILVSSGENGIERTEAAEEISKRFDFVMVDEYQDANMIQDIIFNAVSNNDQKLFVVGDVKQSIYRFRQAMPEIFMARKDSSSNYNPDAPEFPAKINLDANFRSRKCVTDGVNFVFRNLMSVDAGELDYTEEESLKPLAEYPETSDNTSEFHFISTGNCNDDDRIAAEARYTAGLIYKMMSENKITDGGVLRSPTFGDFTILMRSVGKAAPIYIRELMRLGIPAMCENGDSFFSQPEIRLMMSLLRVIDNPARDIPVAAVLMSPIFGFTADEVGKLRAEDKYKGLYKLLLDAAKKNNSKAMFFCSSIEKLRAFGNNVTADELIKRIYDYTLLPEIVLSGDDGEFRRKNLRLLVQYAKKYESSGFRGISGFISFLDKLAEADKDLGAADHRDKKAENAVTIMTIHKSKGLQFPICIVSRLGKKFNITDQNDRILFDTKLGVGSSVIGDDGAYYYNGLVKNAVINSMSTSMISEELRVLYVAMTRAKEKLVLLASAEDADDEINKIAQKLLYINGKISPASVLLSSGFFEMVSYCMLISKSGRDFAEAHGYSGEYCTDDISEWRIVVSDVTAAEKESDTNAEVEEKASEQEFSEEDIASELEKISEKLSRPYKYEADCTIPVKVAASSLAEKESHAVYAAASKPAFMSEGGMSAAERGTALHCFAQHCDFEASAVSLEQEKERLVRRGFLTQSQADCVKEDKIQPFLNSELMKEMLSADSIEREYRFIVEIPASVADNTLEPPFSEEPIVLQGAMDCVYERLGEITIVDYKTDRVKTPDELSQRYLPQLKLYKMAAEQILCKPVTRCVLYSFCLDSEIDLDID